MLVACAVHTPKIGNSIKLTSFRVHLGPNENNHVLQVPVNSKSNKTF